MVWKEQEVSEIWTLVATGLVENNRRQVGFAFWAYRSVDPAEFAAIYCRRSSIQAFFVHQQHMPSDGEKITRTTAKQSVNDAFDIDDNRMRGWVDSIFTYMAADL